MKGKFTIDFPCQACDSIIEFGLKDLSSKTIVCPECYKSYEIDKNFIDKIQKMLKLLTVIQESKELFSNSYISINEKDSSIEVPFKILLTRFNSVIKLNIDNKLIPFNFRFHPIDNKILKQS